MTKAAGEEYYETMARMRAEVADNYCKKCKGSGFDLTEPLTCKNCQGTTKRGKGNCHKCTISQMPTGYVYRLCPDCVPQERVVAILDQIDGKLDYPPAVAVPSTHAHYGPLNVECLDKVQRRASAWINAMSGLPQASPGSPVEDLEESV